MSANGERFRQAWEEDREGMLARLEAARAKRLEEAERLRVERDTAFQTWLAGQGAEMEAERTRPQRFYYERRCVHCGTFFQAPTKEALDAISAERHNGACAGKERRERQEVRRVKHSQRLAHLAGVSIIPDEGREDQ